MSYRPYNIKGNTVILGALNLGGAGDDGWLEYAALSEDDVEVIVGQLGDVTSSAIHNPAMTVTIKVKETTKTYAELGQLLEAQRAAVARGDAMPVLPWLHQDAINGDSCDEPEAHFLSGPGLTKTQRASVREFKILLPNAKNNMRYGAKLLG